MYYMVNKNATTTINKTGDSNQSSTLLCINYTRSFMIEYQKSVFRAFFLTAGES